jgi:hypothetical protein
MSYLSSDMGLYTLEWILSILNKNGPVKVNVGINAHLDDPVDELSDHFIIGTKGDPVSIADCKKFLKRVEKYSKQPQIEKELDSGRSFVFEGVKKVGVKSYEFLWGS